MTNRQWIGTLSFRALSFKTLGLMVVLILGHSVAAVAEPPMDAAELQALEQSHELRTPLLQFDSQRLSPFTEVPETSELEKQSLNDTLEGLVPRDFDGIEYGASYQELLLPSSSPQVPTTR